MRFSAINLSAILTTLLHVIAITTNVNASYHAKKFLYLLVGGYKGYVSLNYLR